jgi:hypothetical protein
MLNKRNKIKSLPRSRYNSLNKYDQKTYDMRYPISQMYCAQCGRRKHLFETEMEAVLFLVYNGEDIASQKGKRPLRTYWCDACAGYHTTHLEEWNA